MKNLDIIIPAYKCADTIGDTLRSLAIQLNKDFNTTIVTDGADPEIVAAVHAVPEPCDFIVAPTTGGKSNGAGATRNYGYERTSAPYVMFLDADDMLMPHAVSTIHAAIERGFDYMIGKTMREAENGNFETVGSEQITWIHGRVYNRSFLDRYGIRFPALTLCEDLTFNMLCAEFAEDAPQTYLPLHVQRYRPGSLSRSHDSQRAQARDYIESIYCYAKTALKHRPASELKLLPDAIAACYYYLDTAERMFPNEPEIYKAMCVSFNKLCHAIDLLSLVCDESWQQKLTYSLSLPSRPFNLMLMPEMTFRQRYIDATRAANWAEKE